MPQSGSRTQETWKDLKKYNSDVLASCVTLGSYSNSLSVCFFIRVVGIIASISLAFWKK